MENFIKRDTNISNQSISGKILTESQLNEAGKKFKEFLSGAGSVAVSGHVRPDGDCIGSCLAVYNYIKNNYHSIKVQVFLEKPAAKFSYLNGYYEIKTEVPKDYRPDLFICLDAASSERLGFSEKILKNAAITLGIDHHVTNTKFTGISIVEDDASSTCELLYKIFDKQGIDKNTAECLYTGIIHDTGVFKYQCTSTFTMEAAAELISKGVDFSGIIDKSYYKKTYRQNQILGRALLESIIFFGGKCIYSVVNRKIMDFYGVDGKDLDGIIDQLRNTEGIEVALFMYEIEPHVYKVSMRSVDKVDVSSIARQFGGGGHQRAAAFTMAGSPHDIVNNISSRLVPVLGDV